MRLPLALAALPVLVAACGHAPAETPAPASPRSDAIVPDRVASLFNGRDLSG